MPLYSGPFRCSWASSLVLCSSYYFRAWLGNFRQGNALSRKLKVGGGTAFPLEMTKMDILIPIPMQLIPIPSYSQVRVLFPFLWESHRTISIPIPFPNMCNDYTVYYNENINRKRKPQSTGAVKRHVESQSRREPTRVLSQYCVTKSSLYCSIITGQRLG